MTICDNCGTSFDPQDNGFAATARGTLAAAICGGCCEGARVVKLVLRRNSTGQMAYEQYAAIEMAKRAG